jgi:hypothetical protein
MTSVLDDYVEEPELARQLGCCAATIRRYCREPDGLPFLHVAGKKLFPKKEVRAWLERRTVRPNPTRKRR